MLTPEHPHELGVGSAGSTSTPISSRIWADVDVCKVHQLAGFTFSCRCMPCWGPCSLFTLTPAWKQLCRMWARHRIAVSGGSSCCCCCLYNALAEQLHHSSPTHVGVAAIHNRKSKEKPHLIGFLQAGHDCLHLSFC